MQDHIAALSPPEFIDWLFTNIISIELDAYRTGREWHLMPPRVEVEHA